MHKAADQVSRAVGRAADKWKEATHSKPATKASASSKPASSKPAKPPAKPAAPAAKSAKPPAPAARKAGPAVNRTPKPSTRTISDDALARDDDFAYEPPQVSTRAPFRESGGAGTQDEEIPGEEGRNNDRFADEDRYTNHSGDPRIGTHNRSYEPGPATAQDDDEDDTPEI